MSDPNQIRLGAFLRRRRIEKGLSVRREAEQIAEQLGESVSSAYISDIENSRREPTDRILNILCKILNLSANDIEPYDARVPSQEMKEMAQANMNYGVAFRRLVSAIQTRELTPEEILKRLDLNHGSSNS